MFAQRDFLSCIEGQLKERGFGEQRRQEIFENFNGLREGFEKQGYGSQAAGGMAMNAVFERLSLVTRERAKRAAKVIEVQAENGARAAQGKDFNANKWVMDGGQGHGAAIVRSLITAISPDPRAPGFRSAELVKEGLRGKYHAILADGLEKFGKGMFGAQKGAEGLYDIVREIFGTDTRNASAKAFAKSYDALDEVMVADFNKAGGSLQRLDTYNLPQRQNPVKVSNADFTQWRDDHMKWLNWDTMRWPDGSPIEAKDHERVLRDVYDTFMTDGATKIDPKAFSGRGSAMGNALENHRFLVYKDADSWIAMHEAYGDGNPIDVLINHVEGMAHKTALVDVMGPNPSAWLDNAYATGKRQAGEIAKAPGASKMDKRAVSEFEKAFKNRLEPMFTQYTRANPMDPNSPMASAVTATANVLTAAKLGGTLILAMPGDFQQTLAMRMLNHTPLMSGIDTYTKGLTTNFEGAQKLATRSGYVFDSLVGATYTTERFSPVATYGPAWSRALSDTMIRASGLTRHTEIARWTVQQELMGMMHDDMKKAFGDLPYGVMLQRYGIGEAEWDAVRKNVTPWSPQAGADFMRPLDILQTSLPNKDDLYQRFAAMVMQEGRYAVPGSTLEANITLRSTTRPDTLIGIIGHSFGMYKNFPITVMQQYGRIAQSSATKDRLSFLVSMGIGMTAVGAMGVQLKEVSKGRTPMPMNTATFWGKAALSGGAMSIWGDFLFGGVNDYGRGMADAAGGPLAGLATDSANLVLGDPFKYVGMWDTDRGDDFKSTIASRGAQFVKQNMPGTSLWWARLALERGIWDRLDEMADPRIDAKRRQQVRKQERTYGNTYYSAPGERLFGK